MIKFRTVEIDARDAGSTEAWALKTMEAAVNQEEGEDYEFVSLTLVGSMPNGSIRFVAAFRRRS